MNLKLTSSMIAAACHFAWLAPLAAHAAPPAATPAFDNVAEASLSAKQKKSFDDFRSGRSGRGVKSVHGARLRAGLDKKNRRSDRVQFAVGGAKTVEHRFHHLDRDAEGYTWVGGDPRSSNYSVMRVHGNDAMGYIRENGKLYKVESAGEGVQEVIEVDESKIMIEGLDGMKQAIALAPQPPEHIAAHTAMQPAEEPSSPRLYLSEAPPAPTTNIDLLVVYTQAAYDATLAAVEWGTIPISVNDTNAAFKNSGASNIAVKAVKIAKVNYTESDIKTDLSRLRGKGDGYLDDVHTLRDQFKADGVIMITGNRSANEACGLAPLNTSANADDAFAVISSFCSTAIYGFAHELGHTLGMDHDTYAVQKELRNTSSSFNNYGMVVQGLYRTIMSYELECSDKGLACAPILYFSNPSISYFFIATGSSTRNNANMLTTNAPKYAAFR